MDQVREARLLPVSTKPAYQRRAARKPFGEAALTPKGPGGNGHRLDDDQLPRLAAALDADPGRPRPGREPAVDPGPGRGLIQRPSGVSYMLRGVAVPAAPAAGSPRRSPRTAPPQIR
jgi:hypothetical protein